MSQLRQTYTVQKAKANLSKILNDARAGKPQYIGRRQEFVVIATKDHEALLSSSEMSSPVGLGSRLLAISPKIDDFVIPERGMDRKSPFDEDQ